MPVRKCVILLAQHYVAAQCCNLRRSSSRPCREPSVVTRLILNFHFCFSVPFLERYIWAASLDSKYSDFQRQPTPCFVSPKSHATKENVASEAETYTNEMRKSCIYTTRSAEQKNQRKEKSFFSQCHKNELGFLSLRGNFLSNDLAERYIFEI